MSSNVCSIRWNPIPPSACGQGPGRLEVVEEQHAGLLALARPASARRRRTSTPPAVPDAVDVVDLLGPRRPHDERVGARAVHVDQPGECRHGPARWPQEQAQRRAAPGAAPARAPRAPAARRPTASATRSSPTTPPASARPRRRPRRSCSRRRGRRRSPGASATARTCSSSPTSTVLDTATRTCSPGGTVTVTSCSDRRWAPSASPRSTTMRSGCSAGHVPGYGTRDRLQRARLGQRVRRARLVEHQRDADGVRVGQVRQPQCVGVVHDVLALADRPAAVGRDLRQRRAMRRAGVRTRPVDEGDPGLLVRGARIGEAGHELVEQRAALGQRHRVEPPDLGGVAGADRGVELSGRLGLELRGLRRGDVPFGVDGCRGPGHRGCRCARPGGPAAPPCRAPAGRRASGAGTGSQRRYGRGVVTTGRAGTPELVGQQQVVVPGELRELAGVDPQLRPHAQGFARLGEDARCRGDVVEDTLRDRLGASSRTAACATRSSSVASMRASPDQQLVGQSGTSIGSAVRRCSITASRRAAATPARSRSPYALAQRGRGARGRSPTAAPSGPTRPTPARRDLRHRVAGQVHGRAPGSCTTCRTAAAAATPARPARSCARRRSARPAVCRRRPRWRRPDPAARRARSSGRAAARTGSSRPSRRRPRAGSSRSSCHPAPG